MGVKGYRVWCEQTKRIITFRDIVFDENSMLVSSVEKPIKNDVIDVVNLVDAQEEVQPPNNDEDENDDVQ